MPSGASQRPGEALHTSPRPLRVHQVAATRRAVERRALRCESAKKESPLMLSCLPPPRTQD